VIVQSLPRRRGGSVFLEKGGVVMAIITGVSSPKARRAVSAAVFCLALFISGRISYAMPLAADTAKTDTGAAAAKAAPPPAAKAAPTPAPVSYPRMRIELDKGGEIVIELYPFAAPKAVERIASLVKSKFYDGLKFHRVESYVVQTGARETDLPPVEGEMFSQKLTHEEGMVGMARLPDDYDSAKAQFYICKKHLPLMNGEYTLFGKVVSGMELVQAIKKGQGIKRITIIK